jgi:hypothetical protein
MSPLSFKSARGAESRNVGINRLQVSSDVGVILFNLVYSCCTADENY